MNPPNINKLTRLLQQLFNQQARDIASRVTLGDTVVPDLTPWVAAIANSVKPLMLQYWQEGMVRTAARLGNLSVVDRGRRQGVRRYTPGNESIFGPKTNVVTETKQATSIITLRPGVMPPLIFKGRCRMVLKAANMELDFDLFNPRVIDAVDAHTFEFCRTTLDTATTDLTTAMRSIAELLKEGLGKGEATQLLAKKIRSIFANPERAYTIAATESSRFTHSGQLMTAKDSGLNLRKKWLASSDACDNCLRMGRKKPIALDKPFYVDPKGGKYAIIMFPPFHPHCYCAMYEVLEDE